VTRMLLGYMAWRCDMCNHKAYGVVPGAIVAARWQRFRQGAELDLRSGSCASHAGRSGSAVPTSCSSVKPANAVSRDGRNTLPEHLRISELSYGIHEF